MGSRPDRARHGPRFARDRRPPGYPFMPCPPVTCPARPALQGPSCRVPFRPRRGSQQAGQPCATQVPASWTPLLLANPLTANYGLCGLAENDSYSNMGWYANVIAVDPTNPEIAASRSDNASGRFGAPSPPGGHPPLPMPTSTSLSFILSTTGIPPTRLCSSAAMAGSGARIMHSPRVPLAPPCSSSYSQVKWTSLNHGFGVTQFSGGIFRWSLPLGGTRSNRHHSGIVYARARRLDSHSRRRRRLCRCRFQRSAYRLR